MKSYLSPWAMVEEWGLEGAEEIIENETRAKWNAQSDCPHIVFHREQG